MYLANRLDFLAPKAKEYQWLLDLYAELPEVQDEDGLYVEAYPGLAYARALSLFHLEKSGVSLLKSGLLPVA